MCSNKFKDVAEVPVWCRYKEYQVPLLVCPSCKRFRCRGLREKELKLLEASKFTEKICIGLEQKKVSMTMYIFKTETGELRIAPKGFDSAKPDFSLLADVEEVLFVSKILVKKMRLVVKSKEEIDKIREECAVNTVENSNQEEDRAVQLKRRSRRTKQQF